MMMFVPRLYKILYLLLILGGTYCLLIRTGVAVQWHCPIKLLLDVPCPGCGSTRAVSLLLEGSIRESVIMNPLGCLTVVALVGGLLTSLRDIICQDWLLLRTWAKLNAFILKYRIPIITIGAVLALLNWWWNICKGL